MKQKKLGTLGNIPARKDLETVVAKDEITMAFLEQFKYTSPMPSIPQMGAVWAPAGAEPGYVRFLDVSIRVNCF